MSENELQQIKTDLEKTTEQLEDTFYYIKELKIHSSIDALILAGLVAVVFQTFSYLLYGAILSDLDVLLYMFSLLIGPAALFLLFLHLYELYGVVKRGEKSIPLTLDLMYFIYIAAASATMIGLHSYYQQHDIPTQIFSAGWNVAALLLCLEVLAALLCAKYIVTIFFIPHLPHFFEHPKKEQHQQPPQIRHPSARARQVYFFRQKPDVSQWQNEDSFVRYKY